MRKIGILGGTFDPIHVGHLRAAWVAQSFAQFETLHFVPCAEPVLKTGTVASFMHRYTMVQIALEAYHTFYTDDREAKRTGPSYTKDTLTSFQEQYPHDALFFILGLDAFLQFERWHAFQDILKLANLIILARPGYAPDFSPSLKNLYESHKAATQQDFLASKAGKLTLLEAPLLSLCAKDIRKSIPTMDPRFLVPEGVYDYITAHHLYQEENHDDCCIA